MAIKVGGTSIIDDNKNISNVGIVTIGASSSGKLNVGSGVTATGDGTLSIAGTVYAFNVVVPLRIDGFSPDNGQTGVLNTSDIRITFNNPIGLGSTGFVKIRNGFGTIIDTFGVGSTYISRADLNKTLVITPSSVFSKGYVGAANTITTIIDASFINSPLFTGINTTGSNITYKFEIQNVALGEAYAGGYFICASGGTQWIVAPSTSEVTRNWYQREDASTIAQQVSGCTGWFVPSSARMQNPGYVCRTYWDSFTADKYWTSTAYTAYRAFHLCMATGAVCNGVGISPPFGNMGSSYRVRSFRCVTY